MDAYKARQMAEKINSLPPNHWSLLGILQKIEDEARRGKFELTVPPISDSLLMKLIAKGFAVKINRKRTKIGWGYK